MKAELQKELFNKYPKIFKQKDDSMKTTCMCWGIECGDGWYWLIDNLCSQLQWDTDRNGYSQIEAVQVKEKYGGLRFYANVVNEKQMDVISFAEFLSKSICEECGKHGATQNDTGWITTLCKECRNEST